MSELKAPEPEERDQTLRAELADRAAEMDQLRRLPADLARKLAEHGLFRLVTPLDYGGLEYSPAEIVKTLSQLAEANASAGWCVMIGATTAMNAAYLQPDIAREIYGDPTSITGGVFAPMGRAERCGDHYRLSGRWQWGSGSANCTWLCGGSLIYEEGTLQTLPGGRPDARMMIFPASEAELIDTWHVMGLKGTGSGDFTVNEIMVPASHSVSLISDKPQIERPLYKFPAFGLLSLGVAAIALGNAKGALSAFMALARNKKGQGSTRTLSERGTVQSETARLMAKLNSAKAYLFDEINQTWEMAHSCSDIPVKRRAALRMACTHMVRSAAEICRSCYDLGGGIALYETSDLQRRFRDAHAMTQHIVTAPASWELTGRLLYDLPTDSSMV